MGSGKNVERRGEGKKGRDGKGEEGRKEEEGAAEVMVM